MLTTRQQVHGCTSNAKAIKCFFLHLLAASTCTKTTSPAQRRACLWSDFGLSVPDTPGLYFGAVVSGHAQSISAGHTRVYPYFSFSVALAASSTSTGGWLLLSSWARIC